MRNFFVLVQQRSVTLNILFNVSFEISPDLEWTTHSTLSSVRPVPEHLISTFHPRGGPRGSEGGSSVT
jgi:hypothetical protein